MSKKSKSGPKPKQGRPTWTLSAKPTLAVIEGRDGNYDHPQWLVNPHAIKQFYNLAVILKSLGKLQSVDAETLALACAAFGRAVSAEELLNEYGEMIEDCKGSLKKNPAAQIFKDNLKAYLDFFKEFGLSKAVLPGAEKPAKPVGAEAFID